MSRTETYRSFRRRVSEVQRHRCAFCFKRCEKLTVDHVVPLSKGGLDNYDNVVGACEKCNHQRSNHDAFMYYNLLHGQITFKEAKKLNPTIPPGFVMLPIKGKILKLYA